MSPSSPLRLDQGVGEEGLESHNKSGAMAAGLRILIQKISQGDSNIVVKTCLKPTSTSTSTSTSTHQYYSCFLKSCFLCNKLLNPDKDVYMYRGDQGFCSVECRGRQIFIDEMKETEISTKRILESIRYRRNSGRCESSSGILEEFRERHSGRKDGGGGGRAVLFS